MKINETLNGPTFKNSILAFKVAQKIVTLRAKKFIYNIKIITLKLYRSSKFKHEYRERRPIPFDSVYVKE